VVHGAWALQRGVFKSWVRAVAHAHEKPDCAHNVRTSRVRIVSFGGYYGDRVLLFVPLPLRLSCEILPLFRIIIHSSANGFRLVLVC
jgi:hypothetical protein